MKILGLKVNLNVTATLAIFLAFITPFFLNEYLLTMAVLIIIMAMISISFNLIYGYTGLFSLAHAAIFGIGAYTSAIFSTKLSFPFSIAIISGVVASGIFALLIAYPSLRLKGHYFGIATLAFGELICLLMVNLKSITGGAEGLSVRIRPNLALPGGLILTADTSIKQYFLSLITLLGICIIINMIVRSGLGKKFTAIRDNEDLAQSLGINIMKYKAISFLISSLICGVAGGYYAHYLSYIYPGNFGALETVNIIMMVIIGGKGTFWGPILGSTFLMMLPQILHIQPSVRLIIYGLILIVILRIWPSGLVGIIDAIKRRMVDRSTYRL